MKFPFRPQLTTQVKSYASNTPKLTPSMLDCTMGVNPYGHPEEAARALREFDLTHLSSYPHSEVLNEAIVNYWADFAAVKSAEVTTVNGSVCGLYYVNSVFAMAEKNEVVACAPAFTDMVENAKNYGMVYRGVPLCFDGDGHVDMDGLIAAIGDKTAMVYVDRPHNPTGQTVSLADMRRLLDAAKEKGAYVMADEAYGDFIPREESCLTLWDEYSNLIVVRTFSKGFGLANLRCGYVIAPENISRMLAKMLNPYMLSDMHRAVCAAVLTRPDHPMAHAADFAAVKQTIRSKIGKKLMMLTTDDRVPIFTLALKGEGDLQAMLLKENVLAISGVEFECMDERYVRMCVVSNERAQRMIDAISRVEQA